MGIDQGTRRQVEVRIEMNRRQVVFAMIALAVLMGSIDITTVVVALPAMLDELQTNLSWIGWVVTAYLLVATIVMPLIGRIGDDFGRKRVFIATTMIFTLASLLSALAPNVELLIVFRTIEAIGGGAFMPLGVGLISEHFKNKRAQMIGLISAINPIGGIIGPNIGGLLIQHFSWRFIFLMNVPLGIVVIILAFLLLRDEPQGQRSKIDIKGAALLSGAALAFMYAMTRLGESEARLGDPLVWISVVLCGVLFLGFVRYEGRVAEPILDLALLRWKPFIATNLLNFVLGICTFGVFSVVPMYAILAYRMTPWESGALLTPRSLASILMAIVASMLLNRLGYHAPLIGGMLLMALSAFLLSQGYHDVAILGWPLGDFFLLAFALGINGLGMGMTAPPANNAAIELMPDRVGAIAGLRGMFRVMGGVMGTSMMLLAMSVSDDQVVGLQTMFFVVSLLLVAFTPLVLAIPRRAGALGSGRARGERKPA